MELNRYQFEILKYLEKNKCFIGNPKELSDQIKISNNMVLKCLEELKDDIDYIDNKIIINEKGLEDLKPYKVNKAIIVAAGFGSRMVPVSLDIPKPLIKVNGIRMIDTLLDSLILKGINDITIVRGYKKEAFDELLDKYPNIEFRDNDEYESTNNISSIMKAIDKLDNTYICEADFLISNPDIIDKYLYQSMYLGSYVKETDDWCFDINDGKIVNYKKGGINCFNAYGISYWNKEDSIQLKEDIVEAYKKDKGIFWEFVPLDLYNDNYRVEVRVCDKKDIVEIDNFFELVELDQTYKDYREEHQNESI